VPFMDNGRLELWRSRLPVSTRVRRLFSKGSGALAPRRWEGRCCRTRSCTARDAWLFDPAAPWLRGSCERSRARQLSRTIRAQATCGPEAVNPADRRSRVGSRGPVRASCGGVLGVHRSGHERARSRRQAWTCRWRSVIAMKVWVELHGGAQQFQLRLPGAGRAPAKAQGDTRSRFHGKRDTRRRCS